MDFQVYRDSTRKVPVNRLDAYKERKDQRFYCQNPACDAHLYRCDRDGVNSSYFRAKYPQHGHISNCKYAKSQSGSNPELFDSKEFSPESLLKSMSIRSSKTSIPTDCELKVKSSGVGGSNGIDIEKKPIKTIKQLHDVFSSILVTEKFGNTKAYEILLDQRSADMPIYSKGLHYTKLVEARIRSCGKHFCNENKAIYLESVAKGAFYRKSDTENDGYSLIQPLILELKFNNDQIYKETLSVFQNFNFNKYPELKSEMSDWVILVYGHWKYRDGLPSAYCDWNASKKDRCFSVKIDSRSQYRIPPKRITKND